jgi:hypothetical protein
MTQRNDSFPNRNATKEQRVFGNPLLYLAIALLVLGTTYSIVFLERIARGHSQSVSLIGKLGEKAYQQSALEWQAVAQGQVSDEVAEKLQKAQEESQAILEQVNTFEYRDKVTEVLIEKSNTDEVIARLGISLKTYQETVKQEFEFLAAGDLEAAETLDETQVDPAFETFIETVNEAEVVQTKVANRYSRFTVLMEAIVVILMACLAIWLL